MTRCVLVLAGLALLATLASAAPAEEPAPDNPAAGAAGGLLDAFRSAGGQLQRVSDGFPLSFNNAASRFQSWVEGAGRTVGKSATDGFQFTRQLFKPLRPEDVRPPSETTS